jgi:hypothetical protein
MLQTANAAMTNCLMCLLVFGAELNVFDHLFLERPIDRKIDVNYGYFKNRSEVADRFGLIKSDVHIKQKVFRKAR